MLRLSAVAGDRDRLRESTPQPLRGLLECLHMNEVVAQERLEPWGYHDGGVAALDRVFDLADRPECGASLRQIGDHAPTGVNRLAVDLVEDLRRLERSVP